MNNIGIVGRWLRNSDRSERLLSDQSSVESSEDPGFLVSSSNIHNLIFGTGCSIFRNSILPAISSAESEVIIVTCFWSRSDTLDSLNDTLRELSAKYVRTQKRIRVRICFSSSSLFQKLFHTTSLDGHEYASSEWQRKLGLPDESELSGLDLEVKSMFVLPFSVMHPKFVIIDRSTVFLPSCNISWETWFEGCVQVSGPIADQFVNFWKRFWASKVDLELPLIHSGTITRGKWYTTQRPNLLGSQTLELKEVWSIFLPSPHHRNPRFTLPWRKYPNPPATPLNTFLLTAFANARKGIYIQTPNLTSPPVLSAILTALKRGVDVMIVTSERLMVLEQLLTAGTTTQRCVKKLIKLHKRRIKEWSDSGYSQEQEAGMEVTPGILDVRFYQSESTAGSSVIEPVQSHLKLTIIDSEITVLGSGNMDRASWYTSQELGVAFMSADFAAAARAQVDDLMRRRTGKHAQFRTA